MLFPTLDRQFDRILLAILAFFPVKQEHYPAINSKIGSGFNLSIFDAGTDFTNTIPNGPANRHSNWPTELSGRNVRPDHAAVVLIE